MFFLLYIKVIISYSFRVCKNDSGSVCGFLSATIFIRHFEHSHCDWLNHTTWYLVSVSIRLCAIGWTIPRGSTRIQRCPVAWNLGQYCFIFQHNTDANMLCRLFDNRKYMDIYLPIHQEYCYLGKQKVSLYFSTSTCEHLWPSPSNLVNCAKCSHNPSKDATDWSVVADIKSLLNFKMFFCWKFGLVELVRSWICRYENIMGILDIQLWELGTQRLHQGLSETIIVNTLTDVREFKKDFHNNRLTCHELC